MNILKILDILIASISCEICGCLYCIRNHVSLKTKQKTRPVFNFESTHFPAHVERLIRVYRFWPSSQEINQACKRKKGSCPGNLKKKKKRTA